MLRRSVAVLGVALALTACAGAPMTDDTAGSHASRPPFRTTSAGPLAPTGTPDPGVPPARWDAILADLAGRGVLGSPVLVGAEEVTWPTGALGCAQPGRSYTQAEVDGMRVVVEVDGESYDYRFGRTDVPRLCTR